MRLDTQYAHKQEGTEVAVEIQLDESELSLTDDELRSIAKNQHMLRWHLDNSAYAPEAARAAPFTPDQIVWRSCHFARVAWKD